ncbi:bifunctional oligoribonuclease/PAP phosphatase NrnA [Candidatus Sumerlaeota bacterium]|nr:bifunctional oligoribonuclease/PAP phosphatase NrnA [Candidatus Sumerlaeota bacterium]
MTEPSNANLTSQILDKIRAARRVQVIGHLRPDGDCIGSLLGMHHILNHFGKENALAAAEHMYPGYKIVPGYEGILTAPKPGFEPDLTVFVDTADRQRGFPDWQTQGFVVNIDHHGSNTRYGDLNWIEADRASAGEMIYQLAREAGVPLNKQLAGALLLAIMTDTGCFRYSSVRPIHFEICAELVRAGGDVTLVSKAAYESRPVNSVKMASSVLSAIELSAGGTFAWGEARLPLIGRFGGSDKLPENLVNEIRSIDGVRVAALFIELAEGGLRASLRADGFINVSDLAKEFGGGGHANAAGLTIRSGDYLALRDRIIARIQTSAEGRD